MPATFALLTFALIALWFRGEASSSFFRRYLWLHLFAGAVVAGLIAGVIQPLGLVWIAAIAAAALALRDESRTPRLRFAALLAFLLLAAGLMSHRLPGFSNPRVISDLRLTSDALPYRLHLNFDKPLIALFFLAACHPLLRGAAPWRAMLARVWPSAVGTMLLLLLLAGGSGYVRFAPKLPAIALLWLWSNLFFTCLAEETLFRGLIQRELQRAWSARRFGLAAAVGVAALLFGLAHFAGGPAYVILATIAGAGYGWAYLRTQSIEAAALTHFALNATHFFLFTYPALAP